MGVGTLTHSPADIVAKLLVDIGQTVDSQSTSAWPTFVNQEPNGPDNCVTVYDTLGRVDAALQPTGEVAEHQGVQIRLRAADPKAGYTKVRAIAVALDETVDHRLVELDTSDYIVYAVTRAGVQHNWDEPGTKRKVFVVNAVVSVLALN